MADGGDSRLSEQDRQLFKEGAHLRLFDRLGAHLIEGGTRFSVWAPNALSVSVIGDFNGWDPEAHPLTLDPSCGVWEGLLPDVSEGALYKYHLVAERQDEAEDGDKGDKIYEVDKADPFGFRHQTPPETASIVTRLDYEWGDETWMASRESQDAFASPMTIYEVHLGSWRRVPEEGRRSLSYREHAEGLVSYVAEMGFTHVEIMPVMEHPFYGSWGYQITGFFAATRRYGEPEDLMYLIDRFHQRGIGVILDWVPGHFPDDEHGLSYFDGQHLFEHEDPREGVHPDWNSLLFNYERGEVRSFLLSSALFWLERFHADGLRVDGVASMLYRDYSRREGEWIPNAEGGRENFEAIRLLRDLNEQIQEEVPGALIFAEESTSWPMVTKPSLVGGLGFDLKWDMGWMHDSLRYLQRDPLHRAFHHNEITFRALYAFDESYILPLSHDEVVHGKGSLLNKMPGDRWQKLANLRLLYAYMYAQPGKKLLFMGAELAQWREWNHDSSLDWHLLEDPAHEGIQTFVRDLNRLHKKQDALHAADMEPRGFEWIDGTDAKQSVISFIRFGEPGRKPILAIFNFTPIPRHDYRIGVPREGRWTELLNTDAQVYGGTGVGNLGGTDTEEIPFHDRQYSLVLSLPPLGALYFEAPD